MVELLVLSDADVEELLDPAGCVDAVERSLVALARGEVELPLRTMFRPEGETTLLGLMPVHRGGDAPLYGLKTIAIAPENVARGLDPHQGTVSLFDGTTGQTVAILNAAPITSLRTAAASALATRVLARNDARALAIVGGGHQAQAHLRVMTAVRDFDEIRIASRRRQSAETLAALHPSARAVDSAEQAVRGADVVVTATSATEPVLSREWLAAGAHVNAVGACFPHTRELDSATVAASSFFVDRRDSAERESGDYLLALRDGAVRPGHIRAELGEVLVGKHPGRGDDGELTVFESLGIAVEDLYAAEYVLERARATGGGARIAF